MVQSKVKVSRLSDKIRIPDAAKKSSKLVSAQLMGVSMLPVERSLKGIWNRDDIAPKARGKLTQIAAQKPQQFEKHVLDMSKQSYSLIEDGLTALGRKYPEIGIDTIGLKLLNYDQKFTKGFTYGFEASYAIEKGLVETIIADHEDQVETIDPIWYKANEVYWANFEAVLKSKSFDIDIVASLFDLPESSQSAFPTFIKWNEAMTRERMAKLGFRLWLGHGLAFDYREHDANYDEFVRNVRSFLTIKGIQSARINTAESKELNNTKYVTFKELVAYSLYNTPNLLDKIWDALRRLKELYMIPGKRIQGKFPEDYDMNEYQGPKIRRFNMVPMLSTLAINAIVIAVQNEVKDKMNVHVGWNNDFESTYMERRNDAYSKLKANRYEFTSKPAIDWMKKESVDKVCSKEEKQVLERTKIDYVQVSADYKSFDTRISTKLQAILFKRAAKSFENIQFKDPNVKKFVISVMNLHADLIQNMWILYPDGNNALMMKRELDKDHPLLRAYKVFNLLPSGIKTTSWFGSVVSFTDQLAFCMANNVKTEEILMLATLGDDVILTITMNAALRIGKNYDEFAKAHEFWMMKLRGAIMNAQKAVSSFVHGIFLQTFLGYGKVYGQYPTVRTVNSFSPENYQTNVQGIYNYAALQVSAMIMSSANLYKCKGVPMDEWAAMVKPILANIFSHEDVLLAFINIYKSSINKVSDSQLWFYVLLNAAAEINRIPALLGASSYDKHNIQTVVRQAQDKFGNKRINYEPLAVVIEELGVLANKESNRLGAYNLEKVKSVFGIEDKDLFVNTSRDIVVSAETNEPGGLD